VRRWVGRSVAGACALVGLTVALAAAAGGTGTAGAASAKGEGALDVLEWPSYSDPSFAEAFEQKTGCSIRRRDVGSSNQMLADLKAGGGGRYDVVSASADIALLLASAHDVRPLTAAELPAAADVLPAFRAPAFNTIGRVHYGVATQWVPNLLVYDARKVRPAPTSWGVLYDRAYRGRISVPNDPLQIGEAALYLMHARPGLGIRDPFELTKAQFTAALALATRQKPLARYWNYAADQRSDFQHGKVVVGLGWPYTTLALKAAGHPVTSVVPEEGITAFADSWMIAAKAPHPVCASLWLRYVLTPQAQAKAAVALGETPVNPRACPLMNALEAGSCSAYHLNTAARYLRRTTFWKTPLPNCGWGGRRDCVPLVEWQQAWARLSP
jgi:putative spermidine/putrescine transport system substrate-binding protein